MELKTSLEIIFENDKKIFYRKEIEKTRFTIFLYYVAIKSGEKRIKKKRLGKEIFEEKLKSYLEKQNLVEELLEIVKKTGLELIEV